MDKNFISIDDLVRQRFSGEEEKDRPAAWSQMRDLLDKEMPQRGGFLYWRRALSVAGLILLATSIGAGSYIYATRGLGNSNGTNNSAVAANTLITNNTSSNNPVSNTTDTKENIAKTTSADANTNNNNQTKKSADHKTTTHNIAANNTAANTKSVENNVAAKPVTASAIAGNTATDNTTKPANNDVNTANSTKQLSSATSDNKKVNTPHAANPTHEKTEGSIASVPPATHSAKSALAADHKEANKKAQEDKAAKRKQFLAGVIAKNEQHKKEVAENRKKEAEKKLLASAAKSSKHTNTITSVHNNSSENNAVTGTHSTDVAATVNDQKNTTHHSRKGSASQSHDVAGTGVSGSEHKTVAEKSEQVNTSKLALGSATNSVGAPNTKSVNATDDKVTDANDKPVASNNSKRSGAKSGAPRSTTGNSTGNTPGGKNKSGASRNGTQQGTAAADPKEEVSAPREKKAFERVLVNERFVSSRPADGYFKLDTISIEQLTKEVGGNSANSRNRHNPGEPGKEESADANENSNSTAAANTTIAPAASSSSATAKGGLTKSNQSSKGSGESTLEKLNATFNDVKYHVTGMQFSPGLTGGINATFFGPNSFKGFQFGVTGNFSFGDNVAAMAEVKYFHRINNNYSLSDNYYTYSQAGNGQFSKQEQSTSYSFSTLHSIEMPISIRYTKSHFNFYAGGNFVYSFSINTGASQLVNTAAPVMVAAQGNDNTPKLHQDDFNSRFGVGYLVGLSYEVYPNLSIDFRNVQTLWDNAPSQGSKIVSGQLYKSPSFQVSIGYRLGGNRKKD